MAIHQIFFWLCGNFTAKNKQQLSLNAGDKVKVTHYSKSWLNATILSNSKYANYKYGIIPKNFIKLTQNGSEFDRTISAINSTSNIDSIYNISTAVKPSILYKPSLIVEFPYICMVFCAIIFSMLIIINLLIFWFFKKKFNKHEKLNKRSYRENFSENSVENKKIFMNWNWGKNDEKYLPC